MSEFPPLDPTKRYRRFLIGEPIAQEFASSDRNDPRNIQPPLESGIVEIAGTIEPCSADIKIEAQQIE